MIIRLSPVSSFAEDPLVLERDGGDLIINGERHTLADLAALEPDSETGDTPWPAGVVGAKDGEITLRFPYAVTDPSEAITWPDPIIDPPDGPVALPYL